MNIKMWIDADACPVVIKEIVYRAANRTQTMVTLISNQSLQIPASPYIKKFQVNAGFDVADEEIIRRLTSGDLVITSDIPLAADVLAKQATALSPRGELFTSDTIKQRLQMRDFLDTLRGSGLESGGPPPLTQRDRQAFANQLDRFLLSAK